MSWTSSPWFFALKLQCLSPIYPQPFCAHAICIPPATLNVFYVHICLLSFPTEEGLLYTVELYINYCVSQNSLRRWSLLFTLTWTWISH
jgi:hypothetical protein